MISIITFQGHRSADQNETISISKMFHLQSFPAFLVLITGAEAIKEARIGNASSSTRHLGATSVIDLA